MKFLADQDVYAVTVRFLIALGHDVATASQTEVYMKTLTKELWMEVPQRRAIVSIHDEVQRLVAESGVQDGLILINPKHIW